MQKPEQGVAFYILQKHAVFPSRDTGGDTGEKGGKMQTCLSQPAGGEKTGQDSDRGAVQGWDGHPGSSDPGFSPLCPVSPRGDTDTLRCRLARAPGEPGEPRLASALGTGLEETLHVDLAPEGRGRARHRQQDDSPPCCPELLAGDSPACAWPLLSRAGGGPRAQGRSSQPTPWQSTAPARHCHRESWLWLMPAPDSRHPVSVQLLTATGLAQ